MWFTQITQELMTSSVHVDVSLDLRELFKECVTISHPTPPLYFMKEGFNHNLQTTKA